MRTHLSLFSLVYENRHTNIVTIYSKEITTTTVTTTTANTINNKVNANSDPGTIIQIMRQGRKYEYKLRRHKFGICKLRSRTGNKIVGQGR